VSNTGQPTIGMGAIGAAVRQLQRALRRTPDLGLSLDGVFGPSTDAAVRDFQRRSGLRVDGVVGPMTWHALPDGTPMPTLWQGAKGNVVVSMQRVLTSGAPGQWGVTPRGIDGEFGPRTLASVRAFQEWGNVATDGVVGDHTWSVSLHAMSSTLESATGLRYVAD
jgi:peptidoglycan hydrolase-like protein with peptidoglycan-binding domain